MRQTVVVVDIIDGCSFRIGSGRTIVLFGLPTCDGKTLEARRARQYLEDKLLHRHVQMEDITMDPQGQIVAQVWADGEEINQAMVEFMRRLQNPVATSSEPPPIPRIDIPVDHIFKEGDQGSEIGDQGSGPNTQHPTPDTQNPTSENTPPDKE